MASVDNWTAGQVFSVRIYKFTVDNPSVLWANTYELQAGVNETEGATKAYEAVQALQDYEAGFHLATTIFDRAVFSTFVEDGVPYNPASFVSVPFADANGTRATTTDMADLRVCVLARRNVAFGRAGRALYRGCLQESDLDAPSGKYILTTGATSALNSSLDISEALAAALDALNLKLVMAAKPNAMEGFSVRQVQSVVAAGVSVKKLNNRYYDRV